MVEPTSAILAIIHIALTTSKELAEAISTMNNSNAEVTRVHSGLIIHTALLRQFHSTIDKANSIGAQMAQHDDLGQNVVNGNKVIIEEMKKLVRDLGFPSSEDVVNPWDRFLFRWRWYLYKPKMTALRQELDSIKTSMTLFVCMVDLEKKMNDPTERISEACITLEEQIFELKKLLKLQKKEIRKTRERLDYVDERRMPALTVDRQIWDLANEQHRRLEPLRRQRRIEQLGPLQTRWPNDSGTSFTSQGSPSYAPSSPPPGDGPVASPPPREVVSPLSVPLSSPPPQGMRNPRIRIVQTSSSPRSQDMDAVSSIGTVNADDMPQRSESPRRWLRDHRRHQEAGVEQEQVYHDNGPENAPRKRESSRKTRRGEGSRKHQH